MSVTWAGQAFEPFAVHIDPFCQLVENMGRLAIRHDMAAAMRAYAEVGFDGYLRVDHVPVRRTQPTAGWRPARAAS
jgi:hypothetical protein